MIKVPLRAVFLDFDDTLSEYPGGFGVVLRRVYDRAVTLGAPDEAYDHFSHAYWNTVGLWAAMHVGSIAPREVRRIRMRRALAALKFGDEALVRCLSDYWDDLDINLPVLRPETLSLLDRLRGQVHLGLITDGFPDLQRAKLKRLDLEGRFDRVQISGEVGTFKPLAPTFRLALSIAGVMPAQAVMVGDNANSDVRGALGVGMQAIHLDPGSARTTPARATHAGDMGAVRRLLEEAGL